MVETTPYKTPPNAPVAVAIGAATNTTVHEGRNTSVALLGKRIGED